MFFINTIIWMIVMVFIIIFGVYFSFVSKGVQFRFVPMIKSLFSSGGDVSPIDILLTSLAGRIGVGSIAGVAFSIYVGGVGSIFWMWISTFFCAVITYYEVVFGFKYRIFSGDFFCGGPSYYIKNGVGSFFLGAVYSILIIVSYIGCFLSIQANTITKSLIGVLPVSSYVVGICISVIAFFCIYGGFKSVVNVSVKLVPVMSIIYVGSAVVIAIMNYNILGTVFFNILSSAFNFKSFFGGFVPMVIIGIQRGIFSNEAGIGTSSIVASSSSDSNFSRAGFVQMFGVYITTFVICTATAIILLTSNYDVLSLNDVNGIELMRYAFQYHFGVVGFYILVISIILFSFSTIVTGYYYGESGFKYFFPIVNVKYIYALRCITLIILFFGSVVSSSLIWSVVDIFVGVMVLINLFSMWKLRNKV